MKGVMKFLFFISLLAILGFLVGCAGPIHDIEKGGMAQMQTSPIILKPGGKYFMVRFQDNTGRSLDCQEKIVMKIRARGKKVVPDEKNADGILTFIPYSLTYRKDLSRASRSGMTAGAIAGGVGAGLLVGFLTGDPGLALAAGTLGAVTGGYIGLQGDMQLAPGVVTIKVKRRIDERIIFIGDPQTALPPPTEKWQKTKKTTKKGKKVRQEEEEISLQESETPVKSTLAVGQSGSSSTSIVTDRRVAQFIPHEDDLMIEYIVDHDTTWEKIKPLVEEQLSEIGAAPFY